MYPLETRTLAAIPSDLLPSHFRQGSIHSRNRMGMRITVNENYLVLALGTWGLRSLRRVALPTLSRM